MLNNRPKTRKTLRLLYAVVITGYVCLFAYGAVNFPQAPYRPCGAQAYCDKLGQQHSKADFDAFSRWQHLFLWSSPFAFVACGVVLRLLRRK